MLSSALLLGLALVVPAAYSQASGPPTPPKYFTLQAKYLSGPKKTFDGQYLTVTGVDGVLFPVFNPINAAQPFFSFVNQTTVGTNTYNMAVLLGDNVEWYGFLTGQEEAWAEIGFEQALQSNAPQLQGGWYLGGTNESLTLRYDWQDWNGWMICYWSLTQPQLFYLTRNYQNFKLNSECGLYQLNVIPAVKSR